MAPFAGTVTAVNITPGETTSTSGQAGAIELTDLTHLQVVADVDEVDAVNVKQGEKATLTLDALPNVTLQGVIAQVDPAGVLTQGVVDYPVTIDLVNPPQSVEVGMTASVDIVTSQHTNVLEVPNSAVHVQGQRQYVIVLLDGQNVQVPVTTGLSNNSMTEITSGLKAGDQVVLGGATTTPVRSGGPVIRGGGFGG